MPVTKTVEKNVRQNERRRAENRARKSRLKTEIAKFTAAPKKDKKKMYPSVQAVIDKTAREGVIHRNKASRLKSRLAKQLD
ncbi:30S ribosomal protein S20 [candidate division WOR-3 bacterium]|uniref:Small ribosomal subunit protein bS20 n=1 Tax=candidate division WOR-3 bacterium TaxID=2052148 RepID=A0A9D5QD26_UNCW3|nr:30S ribosomal protein S20 [candidate division WOR-3 bacterium]MBD3365293.1 30S ribosomal protein S20 [candidate division WOR-3 bacterium]